MTGRIISRLAAGSSVALIADAGTPLISDPGFKLVRQAHAQNIPVSPVPGPAALIAALSAAGVAPGKFLFEGFAPARAEARRKRMSALAGAAHTLVFYETPAPDQGFPGRCGNDFRRRQGSVHCPGTDQEVRDHTARNPGRTD